MRTLVFSDTHLGASFDKKKFEFLKKIILGADRVVIAGDFWDERIITFDQFINSEWQKLFPFLKKKKTIYVYGNHDSEKYVDKRADFFSKVQAKSYTFSSGKNTFIVEHGDFYAKNFPIIRRLLASKLVTKLAHVKSEEILVRLFGRNILQVLYSRYNKKIKEKVCERLDGKILITGHTHAAEIDLKNNFINTGIIRHGLGQYITVNNGKVYLREEWYNNP